MSQANLILREPVRPLDAALFDLAHVATWAAGLYAAAWTRLFDDHLAHASYGDATRGEPRNGVSHG